MLYWWPLVKDLGIPVPKTIFTNINETAVCAAASILGYPAFLRTDLCSGKHDWQTSCYVKDSNENIQEHIDAVCLANVKWHMLGMYEQVMVVREFLTLDTAFTAFAGNMPINKERRLFIENGKILCDHPYWPKTAFNRHPARMAEPGYEAKLEKISKFDGSEWTIAQDYIPKLSHLEGRWSVDFAKGKNGLWYLIDMALADNSYHMPHGE